MIMYKITDPHDPDVEYVIYPTIEEALSGLYDMIEPLGLEMPLSLVIEPVEMTQEEFDALPMVDR